MSFQNKDLLVYFFMLLFILIFFKMNIIFIYRQEIYIKFNFFNMIIEFISQTLFNIFLIIINIAKVTQLITALNALKNDFSIWKYFMNEFEQYIAANKRVQSLICFSLIFQIFSIRLIFDIIQFNFVKKIIKITINIIFDVICACFLIFNENEIDTLISFFIIY